MRAVLPERVRFKYALMFAVLLFVVQQFEHTDMLYSALCSLYVLLFALAFNLAGGMVYPSGNWILFNGLLVVLIGITYKAMLGEAGQTHLKDPIGTLTVECAAMLVFGAVAALNRKLQPKRALFSEMTAGDYMMKAAIGSYVFGTIVFIACWPTPNEVPGTLAPALRQINHFNEMAILLATFYEVKITGGRKSSNWLVWVSTITLFLFGVVSFGKQGMLSGPFTWLIAAIVAGHSFTKKQVLGIILAALFFQAYLVPYSQVARNFRDPDYVIANDARTAFSFLSDMKGTRSEYQEGEVEASQRDVDFFEQLYDEPQGFLDRLTMLPPDDDLIYFTNMGNVEGILPTLGAYANVVPHFIWKDKPGVITGNHYAHEMGALSDEDTTTGISFSPEADAYHQASWYGIFLLLPIVLFILFYLMDAVSGDVRQAPWGVLYIVAVAHFAPEGAVAGTVYVSTFMTLTISIVALFSKYVLPILGGILTNAERTRVIRTRDFRPALRPDLRNPLPPDSAEIS
jgi:hypothetical protein